MAVEVASHWEPEGSEGEAEEVAGNSVRSTKLLGITI